MHHSRAQVFIVVVVDDLYRVSTYCLRGISNATHTFAHLSIHPRLPDIGQGFPHRCAEMSQLLSQALVRLIPIRLTGHRTCVLLNGQLCGNIP